MTDFHIEFMDQTIPLIYFLEISTYIWITYYIKKI